MRQDMAKEIGSTSYPGRGIIIGKTPNGKFAASAYFIMGRSVNSRNRVFVTEGDGIRTEAFDPSLLSDPSLIIYAPVRVLEKKTIITNGDQTDTVYEEMEKGKTFEESLRGREFEPDAPNYTPRISGIIHMDNEFAYEMSILKSNDGDPSECLRQTFSYPAPIAGEGHFIHTYMEDGNPLPSYRGEPTPLNIEVNDVDEFTDIIWKALDEDNKVSLFTRFINLETGETETRIVNKNQ